MAAPSSDIHRFPQNNCPAIMSLTWAQMTYSAVCSPSCHHGPSIASSGPHCCLCSFINNLGGSISFFAGLVLWITSAEWCRRRFFEVCTLPDWLQCTPYTLPTASNNHFILFHLSTPDLTHTSMSTAAAWSSWHASSCSRLYRLPAQHTAEHQVAA